MSAKAKKTVLWCMFVPFLLVQGYLTVGPQGIFDVHGVWEGFPNFFTLSLADPLLTAGLVDFMVVAVLAFWWMVSELPAEGRWGLKTWVWLVSYCVFPGLGFFLYFLWLNPEHRFVS
jgi:hypothetical protein